MMMSDLMKREVKEGAVVGNIIAIIFYIIQKRENINREILVYIF
jgi:hypothetical protein